MTDRDELQEVLEESMKDPEFRAIHEAADRRRRGGDPPEVVIEVSQVCADLLAWASSQTLGVVSPEDAVRALDILADARRDIGYVEEALTRHVYLTGEHGPIEVEGVGRVIVGRGRDRRNWDARGIARAVIDAKMEEAGDGIAPDPWDVASWLLDTLAVSYARVTILRGLGIEPDAFCDSTPGRPSVSLPKRDTPPRSV